MVELLSTHRFRLATDPRDKVYALLGLVAEHDNPYRTLQPNYEMTLQMLMRDVVKYAVANYQSLEILRHCQTDQSLRLSDFPSWAPYWPKTLRCAPIHSACMNSNLRRHRMTSGSPWQNKDTMKVRGLIWDTISSTAPDFFTPLSNPPPPGRSAVEDQIDFLNIVIRARCFVLDKLVGFQRRGSEPRLGEHEILVSFWRAIFPNLDRDPRLEASYHKWLPETKAPGRKDHNDPKAKPRASSNEAKLAALNNMRLFKRPEGTYFGLIDDPFGFDIRDCSGIGSVSITCWTGRDHRSYDLPPATGSNTKLNEVVESTVNLSRAEAIDRLVNRRIYVTEAGYVGLGPRECEPGDRVVVVQSCSMPLLLRRLPVGEGEDEGGAKRAGEGEGDTCFQIIGETYVDKLLAIMAKGRDITVKGGEEIMLR